MSSNSSTTPSPQVIVLELGLQSAHIHHVITSVIVVVWALFHVLMEARSPNQFLRTTQTPTFPLSRWGIISSRGVGLTCVLVSLLLGVTADLLMVIGREQQSVMTGTGQTVHLTTVSITFWTFSLSCKSCAIFVTLAHYYTLTISLSREPIISRTEYYLYGLFNGVCFLIAYPMIEFLSVLKAQRINAALVVPSLFFVCQVLIASAMFLKLNRRMKTVLNEGVLVGCKAIREVRQFRARNWYLISFLAVEIVGMSIWNIGNLVMDPVRLSFIYATTVLSIIAICSTISYCVIIIILYPSYEYAPISATALLDASRDSTLTKSAGGFSSIRLRSYLKRNNNAKPLSSAFPKHLQQRSDDEDDFDEVSSGNPMIEKQQSLSASTYLEVKHPETAKVVNKETDPFFGGGYA